MADSGSALLSRNKLATQGADMPIDAAQYLFWNAR